MRILRVHFKNLNSLWGEWEIDFTHPAYASDGIFAITGPTGAGKSTILDAICLALYGCTPRLKDITQGSNEIMSRQAGECFAEVLFETGSSGEGAGKKYFIRWGQHRARKKPDGALQTPEHEIADAETGQILETRQRDVAAKIEEITGLTFDRFTRSMLLAQGGFATFLQSTPGERAPILEQITGTEIYSQISVRTHEVRNVERKKLESLKNELAEIKIPEEDERERLVAELNTQLQEEAGLEKQQEQCGRELEWLEGMAALQKELDLLEDRDSDLTRRQEGFDSELKRLERAQRALEFGSAHAALIAMRKEQETEKRILFEHQARLPETEADVRRSEEALQLAMTVLSEKQAEQKNVLDLLRRVRELDFRRSEKEPLIREARDAVQQLEKEIEELREKCVADQDALEKAQVRIRDTRKFLQNNAADERLQEHLGDIRARFEALRVSLEKHNRLTAECSELEKQKLQAQNIRNEQNALYETARTKVSAAESALGNLKATRNEILGEHTLAEWREILSALIERKQREGELEDLLARQAEAKTSLDNLALRSTMLTSAHRNGLAKITEQQNKIQGLEKEIAHLETQVELLRRIRDLEEARRDLRDGEPCPLCGSTAHPYASGNMPREDQVQTTLNAAREELRINSETLADMRLQNATIEQEQSQIREESERLQLRLKEVEARLADEFASLQLRLPMDMDPQKGIKQQRQKTEEKFQKTRLIVERAEKIEGSMQNAQEGLDKLREEQENLARSQQEAEFKKESAGREWARLTQEIRLNGDELKNIRLDLIHRTTVYGYKNLPDEHPGQILELLEARWLKWQEHQHLMLDLEKQVSVRERDLHHAHENLNRLNLTLKDRQETEKRLRAERDSLHQQRTGLFGETIPEEEEVFQAAAVEAAQKQLETRREAREAVSLEFATMHSRMEELGRTIHIRTAALQKAEMAFNRSLIVADFKNEDSYLAACLPEEERRLLQERALTLSSERMELETRRTDRKFALEELRRKHLTDRLPEEIRDVRIQLSLRLKELQQSVGAIRLRLTDAEDAGYRRQERMAVFEKQKQECLRWDRLHELIGSADGQKYRNFAQGLTFELVVRYANRQLQKMTDRYLLVRDDDQPLELKVIDSYQAGEIRSTKNLSGGESFIVSLALALGLSQMSSHRVRVDSLFLDEGFGTLDEEALDTALSTLANLRHEGKLIGVISHVGALKERIATQVEVIPQGNGRSVIQAPGCTGPLF